MKHISGGKGKPYFNKEYSKRATYLRGDGVSREGSLIVSLKIDGNISLVVVGGRLCGEPLYVYRTLIDIVSLVYI